MKTFNIEDLASVYQELLGSDYDVQLNANLNYVTGRTQVCIYPTRRPYKVQGINSEVVELYIEVYMPVAIKAKKDEILNHINASINGLQEGNFASNGDTWSYCSTLDFIRPLSSPDVNNEGFYQLVSLNGTVLLSASDGALLLNNTSCSLSITETDDEGTETITSGTINLLSKNLQVLNDSESTLLSNEDFAGAYNKTQASQMTLSFLLMNDDLCKRIVLAAEGITPFEKNQIFSLTTTYTKWDESYTQSYIQSGITISESAGAFSQISLTLMKASSILEG